ncbi:hypothetical protein VWZ88_12510 [Phaeobacter sp. JH20_36]|uniref:hypothetical protein n=1 Tax=unclassified Phaeobacter TaxID=2621772 RepID=UPI003A8AB4E2
MARLKQTIMQRSFTYMEVREDFLEGDDLELRQQSVRSALNMKGLASRTAEARPGTFFERMLSTAENVEEIRPESGLRFGLIVNDDSLEIVDDRADLVHTVSPVPWTVGKEVWISPFRNKVVLGHRTDGVWILSYDDGAWAFSDFAFTETAGGELAQPYWAYVQDAPIQPSAATGNITIRAAKPIWTNAYIGQRIRYGSREIEITGRTNASVLRGTVVSQLPPSFEIGVDDATVFRVGEAVTGNDTNFQGLIVGFNGNLLQVVTTTFFEGPDVGEELSGPAGASVITTKADAAPFPSPVWDEPLMSPLRGYPGSAGQVAGRLVFLDFPQVPDAVGLSSTRRIEDWNVGAKDDDAILRQVGDGAPRWLHAVNMGDLILFSDSGVYNVPARDNGVISPSTFNPVLVDDTGCNEIKPVKVEDGIMFVDASGEGISAAFLDGNVYLKWSVKRMTTYHDHLIKTPRALCGPALRSPAAEKFMFVVNADGTVAAVSWQQSIRDEAVGFAPWVTNGRFVNVAPLFGGYWAIVDRDVGGTTSRFLERFSDEAFLDCATTTDDTTDAQLLTVNGQNLTANGETIIVSSPSAAHLIGETISYYAEGWDFGDFVVQPDGTVDPGASVVGERQIGFNFECELAPWPVESIESPRIGTLTARVLQFIVSVQGTLSYEVTCNSKTKTVQAYRIGDDLDEPPKPRTEIRRFTIYGNRDHPFIQVAKRRPGPFRVLATGQRVQA